jgi:hypothetical protein
MDVDKIQTLIEEVNDKGIQLTNILTQIRELGGDSQCVTIAAQDLEAALTWMVRGIKKISSQ